MDPLSPEQRSAVMKKIGRQDTPPERVVRRLLFQLGLRFRLHTVGLSGKPDIVLPRWRTVVFVHGCFWHGCPRCFQGHRVPKTNRVYWISKIQRNRARDRRNVSDLVAGGWRVLVVWEHETLAVQRLSRRLTRLFATEARPA